MKLTVAKWEQKADSKLAANGLIKINPNKPTFGSLMLIAVVTALSNGFLNVKNKVGFVVGKVEDLESLIKNYNLREGDDFSAKVAPHRIVTIEKLESQVGSELGYKEKINPQTGELLTKDGEVIMWKTSVVPEGSDTIDTLIQHDKIAVTDPAIGEFQRETAGTR